jgi:hypothetical protein
MNAHLNQFQTGQIHFDGYKLLRQVAAADAGGVTWLTERGGKSFLLHVLPIERLLTPAETTPLITLRNHGSRSASAQRQMTLHDVRVQDGKAPLTAVVEAFPPLPGSATEWLTLPEWTARHGAATSAQLTPHLPALAQWLSELPGRQHGSLSPEQCWISGTQGTVSRVVVAAAGLAHAYQQVPELSAGTATWADVHGLGSVLYHWLTGKMPPPTDHALLRKDLAKAHSGDARTPDHWQRLIAANVDADPICHSSNVQEMVDALVNPAHAMTAETQPRVTVPKVSKDTLIKTVAVITVVMLSFLLLGQMSPERKAESTQTDPSIRVTPPAPQPPQFDPPTQPAVTEAPPPALSLPPTESHEKPALLPIPAPPLSSELAMKKPTPQPEKPKAHPPTSTVTEASHLPKNLSHYRPPPLEEKQPRQSAPAPKAPKNQEPTSSHVSAKAPSTSTESTAALPKIRIPYRPPSPPTAEEVPLASSPKSPASPIQKPKAEPEKENTVPKAIPIAKAQVVAENPSEVNRPRIVQALPLAEPLVKAVAKPKLAPLPDAEAKPVPAATPDEQDKPRELPPLSGFKRGPDKPLWVRPSI